MQPDSSQAGQTGGGEPGGAPPDGAGAAAGHSGEGGESAGGAGGAPAGAGGDGAGGEVSSGGVSGEGSGGTGGTGGGAGSMSGSSGGGSGPSCSGCKLDEKKTESRACGRCGTGSQSRTATCDANCTWHWADWNTCSQCDTKNYRCCGAGKWEWCYDSDCAWTNDCAACSASSCPEC